MAKPYFMFKMIKKKNECKSNHSCKDKPANKQYIPQNGNNRCRICLNEGCILIYGAKFPYDLPEAIRVIGGVEVNENDEFPKYLCEDCNALLKGAVLFRKSAQESDDILRQISCSTRSPIPSDDNPVQDTCDFDTDMSEDKVNCKFKTSMKFKPLQAYSVHKNSKKHNVRIQCRICQKLISPQLYEKHLARHQSASHLVCDICGRVYRKDNLVRHLQLHSNDLPFQCQICPYRGRFIESLKIHMRTHSGEKPFSCDKCQLRFITRSNLNRHLLTHEKEKPFKCVECNRGFYTQRDLDVHLRADHHGIKEFGCNICGNKYGTKKALMRHELRVHKRDKMAKGRVPLYLQAGFHNCNE